VHTLTIFERLAYTAPEALVILEHRGLLTIDDHLPTPMARLMRQRAYRRMGRRIRQVKQA